MNIETWFKDSQDYYVGLAIYGAHPLKRPRILKRLSRGKNASNMALLVAELRKCKNTLLPKKKLVVLQKDTYIPTQPQINKAVAQQQQLNRIVKREFGGILLGELPAALRVRYSKAYNIFIEMIELKFALNDLPAAAESSALKIQIAIDKLDIERDLIWKELHHFKRFKTILPTTVDDFSGLTDLQLDLKRRNLKSNISKIEKRVELLYDALDMEQVVSEQRKIESKINKSEKLIHKHKVSIAKINEMI